MDFTQTPHGESSTSSDWATLSYGPVVEMDDGPVFPFTLYDPCALHPAHPTWQSGSLHPRFDAIEPSFATKGSSSFFSTVHALPPVHGSTWNDVLSDDIGPSPVSGPSVSSMYAAQHVSGDNVCHAVVSNWLLLTSPLCR